MRASWFSAAAAVCLAAAPAQAQDRPVVFVHGLHQASGEWSSAANVLTNQLLIGPILPTLGWDQTYETQADILANAVVGDSNVVAVSHSNGGIVTRQYGRTRGSGSHITGHVAVGSLHQGAWLATNVRNGSVESYAVDLVTSVVAPVEYYTSYDQSFADDREAQTLLFVFLNTALTIAQGYTAGIGALGFPIPTLGNPPVLSEMGPGTSFMADPGNGLNSAGSLAAEASAFQQRISISTAIPSTDVLSRIWCGSWCNSDVRSTIAGAALGLYEYYSESDDQELRDHASLWRPLAQEMLDFDLRWHAFIGSLVGFDGSTPIYSPQDGILPLSTQTYVNGSAPHIRLAGDISHLEQPANPTVIQTVSSVLRNNFGIPFRQPPTITVTPSSANLLVFQSVTLSATARDFLGNVLTDPVVWVSSNNAIATVTTSGVVTGVGGGSATITATVAGVNAMATISVLTPSVYIQGPFVIKTKGIYSFPATTANFPSRPSFTWRERFCSKFDWEDGYDASCTEWVSVPNVGSTYTRTLGPACPGHKNWQLHVDAWAGSASASGDHVLGLCIPYAL